MVVASSCLSLDTETTGVDLYHGAKPFFVTLCRDDGQQLWWEWSVDPLTRQPQIPAGDLQELAGELAGRTRILQNAKFDVAALRTLDSRFGDDWPWAQTHDTLLAGHLLASNQPHNLTDMALHWLGVDIEPYEQALKQVVNAARRVAKKQFPDWHIAREGLAGMPSAKSGSNKDKKGVESDKPWKFDSWLPRALLAAGYQPQGKEAEYDWATVLRDYANADSAVTLALWRVFEVEIDRQKLRDIYECVRQRGPLAYHLERRGVTLNRVWLENLAREYEEESQEYGQVLQAIAKEYGHQLVLPKGGRNNSLLACVTTLLECTGILKDAPTTPTGTVSLDARAKVLYYSLLPQKGRALSGPKLFFQRLLDKGKRDTALGYLRSYQRFWLPLAGQPDWYVLHPQLNPTGTDTLRWSSSNPNEQNICFDGETEVLTRQGWVLAKDLRNRTEVAQYWKETGVIDFAPAEVHQPTFQGEMIHLTTEQGIDLLLTPKHRCLLRHRKTRNLQDVSAENFKPDYQHLHAGYYQGGEESLSRQEVTWLCAVQADGHYHQVQGYTCGIRFIFAKKRKIAKLRACLVALGAKYTEKVNPKGLTDFYVHAHDPCVALAHRLMPRKCFGDWLLNHDRATLDAFAEEVFFWDGDWTRKTVWSSSQKENADWVQVLMALSGHRATLASRQPSSEWAIREHHYVNIVLNRDYSLTTNFSRQCVPWHGPVYCVTVPSSYLVIRRNGKVAITGNSKKGMYEGDKQTVRCCFGPAPGWEWWSFDAKNIELRIPAYASEEQDLINLFEKADEPPYYGSTHLLNFATVYPDLWAREAAKVGWDKVGPHCKKEYAATYYQWCKNGGFAIQYNCGERTADRAFRQPGAFRLLKSRFAKLEKLNQRCLQQANKYGYVETLPDRTVDPQRGYPLLCTRTERGSVLTTVPLSYFVQGTAMWWTMKAMLRVHAQLEAWRQADGFDAYIAMQVHDELVVAMPRRAHPRAATAAASNLGRARVIQQLMAQGGDDIGVPTPVGCEFHDRNWAEGETL